MNRFPEEAPAPEIGLALGFRLRSTGAGCASVVKPKPPSRNVQIYAYAGLMIGMTALWMYLVSINAFGATADPTPASSRFLLPLVGVSVAILVVAVLFLGRSFAGAVLGLGLLFGVLSLLDWGLGWAADRMLPVRLGRNGRVGLLFGVLLGLAGIGALGRQLRSLVASWSKATIWLNARSSAGGDVRETVVASQTFDLQLSCSRITLGSPIPLPHWTDLTPWSAHVETPALTPYAEAASAIDPDVLRPLAEIARRGRQSHLAGGVARPRRGAGTVGRAADAGRAARRGDGRCAETLATSRAVASIARRRRSAVGTRHHSRHRTRVGWSVDAHGFGQTGEDSVAQRSILPAAPRPAMRRRRSSRTGTRHPLSSTRSALQS